MADPGPQRVEQRAPEHRSPATRGHDVEPVDPTLAHLSQTQQAAEFGPPRAPLPDTPRTLDLAAGERLTVAASAPGGVELRLTDAAGRVIEHAHGSAVELTHLAPVAGAVHLTVLAPLDGGQSGRVMISRAPAEQAETASVGDGSAVLTRRHHLLLNLFGVTPTDLHPDTTLALARQLDALELTARALGENPDAMPALADAALSVEHTDADGYETAVYTLSRPDAQLTLATAFDHHTGQLDCALDFAGLDGTTLTGRLSHVLSRVDGMPQTPAADPIGGYLAPQPEPEAVDLDLDDLIDRGDPEGITAFLTGAFAGDFADDDSYSALAGQTAIGFVPVAGQIADARDIAAAGADVLDGAPGAWGRLGINVIAVIPGLDFLKAGRLASREAIREGAETALDETTRHSVKKLRRRGMSKAAAARAAKEITVINAGRVELIARLQRYSAEGFFDAETLGVLMKTRNALQNGLKPSDLVGALRDLHGIPVPHKTRVRPYDHLHEVRDAMESIENALGQLKRVTKHHAPGTAGFARLSRDRDAFEEFYLRLSHFLESE